MSMPIDLRWHKGTRPRSDRQQVELAVRVVDGRHGTDIEERLRALYGERYDLMMVDCSRNMLAGHAERVGRAYDSPPPFVANLGEPLARLLDDFSATVTVDRYATAGGRPMPSTQIAASSEALRYRVAVGYAGVLIGWSPRSLSMYLEPIAPDDLSCEYASDDPMEPTVIEHRGVRPYSGQPTVMIDRYDLTDLGNPSYKVHLLEGDGSAGKDVTQEVHGQTYSGASYPWRYKDGRPFHRVVITGRPSALWRSSALVDASLSVAARWSSWGLGFDTSQHPQRNVEGLELAAGDSSSSERKTGLSVGPETVVPWVRVSPEEPGAHWQDAAAFSPLDSAKGLREYEASALDVLGYPGSLENVGGEPTEYAKSEMDRLIARTLNECRRFDGEILRRVAATANRMPAALVPGSDYPEDRYGCLYRDEVGQALASVQGEDEPEEEVEVEPEEEVGDEPIAPEPEDEDAGTND